MLSAPDCFISLRRVRGAFTTYIIPFLILIFPSIPIRKVLHFWPRRTAKFHISNYGKCCVGVLPLSLSPLSLRRVVSIQVIAWKLFAFKKEVHKRCDIINYVRVRRKAKECTYSVGDRVDIRRAWWLRLSLQTKSSCYRAQLNSLLSNYNLALIARHDVDIWCATLRPIYLLLRHKVRNATISKQWAFHLFDSFASSASEFQLKCKHKGSTENNENWQDARDEDKSKSRFRRW